MRSLLATATCAAVALVVLLAYSASCWWLPFANCGLCSGTGKRYPENQGRRRNFRPCWWCKGTGRRLRWGRRLFNAVQRRRREAQS
jgi:hypothetical protein